jgi:hypothetical protein
MLIAKPGKGTFKTAVGLEARAELFADEEKIGSLFYELGAERATIDLRGETFFATRQRPRAGGEFILSPLIRLIRGEKLPPNPFILTDVSGRQLATALKGRGGTVIEAAGERFEVRRSSTIPHSNDLIREGVETPLGTVSKKGQ